MMEYHNYEELHTHPGSDNYEILTVLPTEYEIVQASLNKEEGQLIVGGKTNPIKEKERETKRLKISVIGTIMDEGITNAGTLRDGTLKGFDFYSNWIINGDTTKYRYLKPFSDKSYEPKEWLNTFKGKYDEASSSYYFNGRFYLKINEQWNEIDKNFDIENFNFDKHFPDKYDTVRMIELEDHTPDFSRKAFQRDTSLWTYHGYEEADREEGGGLDPITFSAGWHYLQLKMPAGEPLKIKRYGSMGVNLHTYIIPDSLGGREDVIFIVQEPSSLYPDREYGGMYVVRPREL
ncbi:hypothetical protein SAMN05443144_13515 [Fodinibius roseus]|uniref:Uncharacterized protein n=1 Tax=Fodinibius roseus TaxID=1194090 RepID=A0A1M5KXP5_9BACT|nr:hypothetical protein [Fodinibius roseus]SHG57279.1 hypothetical protein SAMN05443144_13515 [Fodinibius roseus]